MSRRVTVGLLLAVVLLTAVGFVSAYRQWNASHLRKLAEQCRLAARHGKWELVQNLANEWIKLDPKTGEPLMYLGRAAQGNGDWAKAVDFYLRVPETDVHVVPSLGEVAQLAFGRLNEPVKGAEALERLLAINPRIPEAQKQLIGYYASTLQRQKLVRQIRSAIQAESEPAEAYPYFFLLFTLRDNNALALNERWLKKFPDEETFVVAHFLLRPELTVQDPELSGMSTGAAPEYPSSETNEAKLEQVDAVLKRFPQNIELLAYKANLCMTTGDVNGAIAVLSQAPKSARDDARFWRLEGWIHEAKQELDKARSAYRKALELHTADWNSMIRLAVIERRTGNVAEVRRLTGLIDRAMVLRRELRKKGGVENPVPEVFVELSKFYRDCGERLVGQALDRRIQSMR